MLKLILFVLLSINCFAECVGDMHLLYGDNGDVLGCVSTEYDPEYATTQDLINDCKYEVKAQHDDLEDREVLELLQECETDTM